ncbi:MAG: hypothetical protein NTV19_20505, partial [Burkholderiales bacterium]|nr:hypothetical protein [Burkholderiales bacterium]
LQIGIAATGVGHRQDFDAAFDRTVLENDRIGAQFGAQSCQRILVGSAEKALHIHLVSPMTRPIRMDCVSGISA